MNEIKVIDGYWTKDGIILKMKCECGEKFEQKSWKRKVKCPKCKSIGDLIKIKNKQEEKLVGILENE